MAERCVLSLCPAVPQVVKSCAEFIEKIGVVDGIYRLSGISSNIQKLRFVLPLYFTIENPDQQSFPVGGRGYEGSTGWSEANQMPGFICWAEFAPGALQ